MATRKKQKGKPRGARLGARPCLDRGMKVEFSLGPIRPEDGTLAPPGWYVWIRLKYEWQAVLPLRFADARDAGRAMDCLREAGLDNAYDMQLAGYNKVLEVACSDLRW